MLGFVSVYFDDDNISFDNCAFQVGLDKAVESLCQQNEGQDDCFKRFGVIFFVNGSARGPFVSHRRWTDAFVEQLDSDDVSVVSATVSCQQGVHAQSFVLALKAADLHFFTMSLTCNATISKEEVIQYMEIGTSTRLLDAGKNIASVLPFLRGIDWRQVHQACPPLPFGSPKRKTNSRPGCCNFENNPTIDKGYLGTHTFGPFESVFVKTAGGIVRDGVADMMELDYIDHVSCVRALTAHRMATARW
eukprot:CAMPEP_0196772246 /NCGR_PEP_ID=MMETSP1104-20130614/2126_1 /TAXON_ID=33652 /ORGANISM="Cafeteria sp., Strain Caron Lab Isolate" /LENGTH=246 /DNA_ID=CAMNT_0042142379 /DNA_START=661 /DNA_END=1401 /DNA_ORIENTATION=-